ncbi:uncharacterized protein LOC132697602 isoform X1 [Cylas formicarius]|uniref:uncharacterized protein LOC132697602 isoform X1 n=1 Tax=Cylas formicarius TaxID=197179 RepID=UPI002958DCEA|nr:uncharacterized protein LOC132697602 isoform X1 [Cylas formicarius]
MLTGNSSNVQDIINLTKIKCYFVLVSVIIMKVFFSKQIINLKCKCLKIFKGNIPEKHIKKKSKFVSKSCTCRRDVHEKRFGGISEVQPHTSHKGKCKINFNWRMVKENTGKQIINLKCKCLKIFKGNIPEKHIKKKSKFVSKSCTCRRDVHEKRFGGISEVHRRRCKNYKFLVLLRRARYWREASLADDVTRSETIMSPWPRIIYINISQCYSLFVFVRSETIGSSRSHIIKLLKITRKRQ